MGAKYLWRKAGSNHLLVDADGHPFYCEHCPCSPCQLAIWQRQSAVKNFCGSWINVDGSYTLDELKAFVNACCAGTDGMFVEGPYDGGVDPPAYLPSGYASSATTVDELCALVAAMIYTRVDATLGSRSSRNGVTPDYIDWDGLESIMLARYALAATDWQSAGWVADGFAYCSCSSWAIWPFPGDPYPMWNVSLQRERNTLGFSGVPVVLSHASRLFLHTPLAPACGLGLPEVFAGGGEGFISGYNKVGEWSIATIAARTSDTIGNSNVTPAYGTFGSTPPYLGGSLGWSANFGGHFAVLEWGFTA
jgi:hypothetical protein